MKHNMTFSHTGKCAVCGKDTKLLIHRDCSKNSDTKKPPKAPKKARYSKKFIDNLVNRG